MKRFLTFTTLALLAGTALLTACGGGGGGMEVEERSYAVETTVVATASTTVERELSGILRGEMEAMVAPEISGRLSSILVEIGDEVGKGTALARIEGGGYWASAQATRGQLESARLQLSSAESNYNRYKPLHEDGSISDVQWEQIETGYEIAKASVEAAEGGYNQVANMASETTIRAPIAGVVAARNSDIGSMVGPQYPVFEIVRTDPMKVVIGVSEADIGYLEPNENGEATEVIVQVEAYPGEEFIGYIHNIGVKADAQTHSFPVEIRLENPDQRLKSGMIAHVNLPLRELGEVITVPLGTLITIMEVDYIYVVDRTNEEIRVNRVPVITGAITGDRIVILEGLTVGDEFVSLGQQFLEQGSLITIPGSSTNVEKTDTDETVTEEAAGDEDVSIDETDEETAVEGEAE